MQRCFDLARLGAGRTSPNPMVGAVLTYRNRIIGEGYHQAYGQAHAEVNAVNSVKESDRHLLPYSTLYVSLEPCNIHRNTPPCTLLILQERIPRVVISYIDHTPGVDGSGVARLREAGVDVVVGVLRQSGQQLSQARNTFVQEHRPYIILKYAQSADGFFAPEDNVQQWLSNAYSKRLVHKWRSEVDAILVGANTVLADNPRLNNRLYFGASPCRIILDRDASLPGGLNVFDGAQPTLVFSEHLSAKAGERPANTERILLPFDDQLLPELLRRLASQNISTLLVEGGLKTMQRFLNEGLWDEARVFTAEKTIGKGRPAPTLPCPAERSFALGSDRLQWYRRRF